MGIIKGKMLFQALEISSKTYQEILKFCVCIHVVERERKTSLSFLSISRKMPRLTIPQRTWVCIEFARTNNATEVLRRWPNQWPNVPPPSREAIIKNYRKFGREGTCHNLNKGRSGRRPTVMTQANKDLVRRSLQQNGRRSCRRNGVHLTRSSFNRIVKEIKFHPYVLVKKQKLQNRDPARRLTFCNWFRNMNNANFLSNLIISDEAIFSMNSDVNTRNVIYYSAHGNGHPDDHYVEFEQGADQVMVWMGLTGNGLVLGPHFVQGRLDTREYMRIVRYHVIQRDFVRLGIDKAISWWIQDGATPHTSNASLRYLRGQFPRKVVNNRGDVEWPPRSPDLTVCDFFLWGYMKQQIWEQPQNLQPQTLDQLKASITNVAANLDPQMIRNAFAGMVNRVNKCFGKNGNTFPDE